MQSLLAQFTTYFNDIVGTFTGNSIGLGAANFNLISVIFLCVLLVVFLLGVTFGRSRILIGLLSLYVARLLESNFIYFDKVKSMVSSWPEHWLHFGLFVIFAMGTFVLIQAAASRRISQVGSSIPAVTALSFLSAGFLASLVLSYLPVELGNISPNILQYFTSQTARFWWSVAPLLSLVFLRS